MSSVSLDDYRCECGKLLLKGIFFDGTLEIKCRRCGEINKVGSTKLQTDASHYVLIVNNKGMITNLSDSACLLLGYVSEELIGKHFSLIFPTVPRELGKKFLGKESILNEDNYVLLNTVHQTKRGQKISIAVYLKLQTWILKERKVIVSVTVKNTNKEHKEKSSTTPKFIDQSCDFYFDMTRMA